MYLHLVKENHIEFFSNLIFQCHHPSKTNNFNHNNHNNNNNNNNNNSNNENDDNDNNNDEQYSEEDIRAKMLEIFDDAYDKVYNHIELETLK
eukprot:Pgem_evm1s8979